ncbi:MAG: hypothetical protein KGZ80_07680 [Methylomonas sp.]|nr:hypothetical protein [Methylomonas sp.]
MIISHFKLKASKKEFTSYAGLALAGQGLDIINVEAVVDGRIPVSQGIKTSDVVKSATGLLSIGKSDFEAIEPFGTIVFQAGTEPEQSAGQRLATTTPGSCQRSVAGAAG